MSSTAHEATSAILAHAAVLSSLVAGPVDADLAGKVRDPHFAQQWERTTPEALRGLALLRESTAAREDVDRLLADYSRLFGAEGCGIVACESAYLPGVTAADLEELYSRTGMSTSTGLPADHLATELRFVAWMDPSALPDFMRHHLGRWATACFGEIALRAGSLFYQGVGVLGMDYVESLPDR